MKLSKEQQIEELLTRGVAEVIDSEHLSLALHGKQKLRVKLGMDPTSPNIHIGRAVLLWKLRAFQDLGHKVVFIVGDTTGVVGDTSDKDSERPMLSESQIKKNLKTYFKQAFKILDQSKTETHYNSEWLKKLGFLELARMASLFSLHEFESRELIAKRLAAGQRVTFHEAMYPLMQGYDSVAVKANVELGGTDQRFNLLAGRTIQKFYGQAPQDVLMTDILEGLDGRKMSSSWGNVINITDTATDMFGKVMSLRDELIERYFVLATRVSLEEIKVFLKDTQHPRDQKLRLAFEITNLYHGKKAALEAQSAFVAQFSKKELPSDIAEKHLSAKEYSLVDLVCEAGMAGSRTEATRLISQGGVKINQEKKIAGKVTLAKKEKLLLQVGKRKFLYVIGE